MRMTEILGKSIFAKFELARIPSPVADVFGRVFVLTAALSQSGPKPNNGIYNTQHSQQTCAS